jgi:alkanesulfonate monooxygenase SsuD/methylene tetrahydromethanopterin reductase-like flavin-dependent oxidoreductase (luciferase family)
LTNRQAWRLAAMKFSAHYLTTYIPELDGPEPELYEHLFEQFALLDELGYHQAWVTEHHFHEYGGTIPDPAAFLTAAAVHTRRLRLGVAISVLPLHHPLKIAESYAMVDAISHGRLDFGVGRGNSELEQQQFGLDYAESPTRFKESAEVIRQAWSQSSVSFQGQHYAYDDIRVLPSPVQRPHPPFWVAANRSDDTYRWAGEQACHLLVLPYMYEPAVLRQAIDTYRAGLERVGIAPSSREVLGRVYVYVADSEAEAVRECGAYLDQYWRVAAQHSRAQMPTRGAADQIAQGRVIAGSADRVADLIQKHGDELGMTIASCSFHFGGMPQEMALSNIRRFAAEVMPRFASPVKSEELRVKN